jgi:nucleoside-diphosphate-sugar epimerase
VRVFVTGGSSPLGELVLPRLSASHDVYALARSDLAIERVEYRGASPIRGMLEHPGKWIDNLKEADAVVHLAGMRFVDAIVGHVGADQPLTVIGSASVRNPAHPRSDEFLEIERRLLISKPDRLVVLRPTMIYGSSGDRNIRLLVRLLAALPAIPRLVGGSVIQPVLADDVADAIATTLGTRDHVEADIGGPVPVRMGDVVATLARLLKKRVVPVPIPVSAAALLSEALYRIRPSRGIHALAMLRHDRAVVPAGSEIFGHSPTSMDEGLAIAVSRYRRAENQEGLLT